MQSASATVAESTIICAAILAAVSLPVTAAAPGADLSAEAAFLFEPTTGTILYEKNADARILTTDWAELTGKRILEVMEEAQDLTLSLMALAEAEDTAFGSESSLLPQQAADAKDKKKAISDAEKKMKAARQMQKDAIPDTYVVQDGDTLYKIAMRFYGRTSAWKQIREANKETISTDGRVRSGMTIRLPK